MFFIADFRGVVCISLLVPESSYFYGNCSTKSGPISPSLSDLTSDYSSVN